MSGRGQGPNTCTAGELAQGHIAWVDADTEMTQIVDMMGREQVKRMPVIDDHQLGQFVERVFADA